MENGVKGLQVGEQLGFVAKLDNKVYLSLINEDVSELTPFTEISDVEGRYNNFTESHLGLTKVRTKGDTYSILDIRAIFLEHQEKGPVSVLKMFQEDVNSFWAAVGHLIGMNDE